MERHKLQVDEPKEKKQKNLNLVDDKKSKEDFRKFIDEFSNYFDSLEK